MQAVLDSSASIWVTDIRKTVDLIWLFSSTRTCLHKHLSPTSSCNSYHYSIFASSFCSKSHEKLIAKNDCKNWLQTDPWQSVNSRKLFQKVTVKVQQSVKQLLECSNQISASNKQLIVTPLIIHYHCKPLWPFQIFPAIFVYILVLLWCMQPV